MDYNRQYFNKDDIAAGLHLKFIQFLLENFESDDYRVDLRVYYEDYGSIVVEWVRVLWKHIDEMGQFAFLGDGQHIMQEVILPDNSITYAHNDEEAEELIKEWRKVNKRAKEQE